MTSEPKRFKAALQEEAGFVPIESKKNFSTTEGPKGIGLRGPWKETLGGAKTAPVERKHPQRTTTKTIHRERTDLKVAMAFLLVQVFMFFMNGDLDSTDFQLSF